jgi:hypothetical protein
MKRLHYINLLKDQASKMKGKKKLLFGKLLAENEFDELGGKLSPREFNYVFDDEPMYRTEHKMHRDNEPKWIAFCDTCGRYASMRWWFEQPPDLEDIWKEFVNGEQLYSTKDTIIDCLTENHSISVRPFSELGIIKEQAISKRMEAKDKRLLEEAEQLLDSILA